MVKPATLGIVCIICLIALLATDRIAVGQAGSIGGTVGKTDKSISGDEPEQRQIPVQRPNVEKSTANSCHRIVGTWSWHSNPLMNLEAVFRRDGSNSGAGGFTGHWSCAGTKVTATWSNGAVDTISISSDGNGLAIQNNWGASFTAERK
jgi:hypothetical protein